MDNEREVTFLPEDDDKDIDVSSGAGSTDLVERSKLIFLREVINEFKRKQQQYDLPLEFAKTKKNRSAFVPITIVILLLVFGGLLFAVTTYIQRNSRNISVNIQDFADVNLRDILDSAKRLQNELAAVERELEAVIAERDDAIEQVESARERQISLAQESGLSAAQEENRITAARTEAEGEIAAINEEYQPRIDELQAEIVRLEEEIAEYDARQLAQAEEQEETLNNQQRVFDLQMQEVRDQYEEEITSLTNRYENRIREMEAYQTDFERTIKQRHADEIAALTLRFNPNMTEEQIADLLDDVVAPASLAFDGPVDYDPLLGREDVINRGDYQDLVAQYEAQQRLLDRLRQVPYINSVPDTLEQIDQRSDDLLRRYEDIWQGLRNTVMDRDSIIAEREGTIAFLEQRIDEFLYALDDLSIRSGEAGYILDPRDEDNMVVFVNQLRTIDAGTTGYIFRRDDEYVGLLRFVRGDDGRLKARLVELAPEQVVLPYDKVLIELQ